jgi:hypothetical protein
VFKRGFALKVTSPCHSEHFVPQCKLSEESVLSSFGNGFFVTTFLRMTFEAKPRRGGVDAIDTPLQIPESLRLVVIKSLAKQSRQPSV